MKELSKILKIWGNEKPRFRAQDAVAEFEGRAPDALYSPEVNYDALYRHYGLEPRAFREKVACLKDLVAIYNQNPMLDVNWVTSADVMAQRAGRLQNGAFLQLAAIGVTLTKDNQVLVGVRGGKSTPERVKLFGSGLYGLPPGGSVKFGTSYTVDPITDTLIEEFREEVGDFGINSCKPLGVFEAYLPGPEGIKFLGLIKTDASLDQIRKMNVEANRVHSDLTARGLNGAELGEELKRRNLPEDAWEHSEIFGLPNDSKAIRAFLGKDREKFAGIGYGALDLYASALEQ